MYEILAEAPRSVQLDWQRVEVFWGDERAVGPEHPESNYGVAASVLLGKLGVMPDRIHRIQGEPADPEQAAARYQDEESRVFAVPDDVPPIFDLIFLGMGADGHTGSLFPYSQALTERRRWVVGYTVARLGKPRITMTPPVLNRAAEVRLLVTGADKAGVLREALEGPREPQRPAGAARGARSRPARLAGRPGGRRRGRSGPARLTESRARLAVSKPHAPRHAAGLPPALARISDGSGRARAFHAVRVCLHRPALLSRITGRTVG